MDKVLIGLAGIPDAYARFLEEESARKDALLMTKTSSFTSGVLNVLKSERERKEEDHVFHHPSLADDSPDDFSFLDLYPETKVLYD